LTATTEKADLSKIAKEIRQAARDSTNEEELRIKVEGILGELLSRLGIKTYRAQERTVISGRVDALYGDIVVEYKSPGKFRTMEGVREALYGREAGKGGLHNYLLELATQETFRGVGLEEALSRKLGVGLDGERIFFYRYRSGAKAVPLPAGQTTLSVAEEKDLEGVFERVDVTDIERGVNRFLLYIRTLSRFPLTSEVLAEQFGLGGKIGSSFVDTLYTRVHAALADGNPHVTTLFREWERIFGIVYDVEAGGKRFTHEEMPGLSAGGVDVKQFLFSAHTYLNLILEFIVLDVLSSLTNPFVIREDFLGHNDEQLRRALQELEDGETFRIRGIDRFYEGVYFQWYLDVWDEELAGLVREFLESLERFDPATSVLRPEAARDVLKHLYQSIVPERFRHNLGEYFTPDWLAQRVLDVIGYTGQSSTRVLDPACGSGTFLVEAVKRLRANLERESTPMPEEELREILGAIVGFDINPVSVLVSKVNYLLALGELILSAEHVVIPVYQCDSILAPKRVTSGLVEPHYLVKTTEEFELPILGTHSEIQLAMDGLSRAVRDHLDAATYLGELEGNGLRLSELQASQLRSLHQKVEVLAGKKQDGMWPRMLASAFAPAFSGKFDLVVGNPPWVNWDALSTAYKNDTKDLWEEAGLFGKYRGEKDDLCLLMAYTSARRYLVPGGRLCFLLPQSVWQSKEGAARFRRFEMPGRNGGGPLHLSVKLVEDFSAFQPFDATNRTSLALIERDAPTVYPVQYHLWKKVSDASLESWASWEEIAPSLSDLEWMGKPVDARDPTSPWIVLPPGAIGALDSVLGKSDYSAREGVNTRGRNGIYYVDIEVGSRKGLVSISNDVATGRLALPAITRPSEADPVFPLLRGSDVEGLEWSVSKFILVPHTRKTGMRPISPEEMARSYPLAFGYLRAFKSSLETRTKFRAARPGEDPFYQLYEIGPYSFSAFKVVWPYVRKEFAATVVSPVADKRLGHAKPVIVDTKLMMVECSSLQEANYVAGMLNSTVCRVIVDRLMVETQLSTYLLDYFRIPRFSASKSAHRAVATAFARLRLNARAGSPTRFEAGLDTAVSRVLGIKPAALKELRRIFSAAS
jgi:hypothetical protein